MKLADYIEQSILKPEATKAQIEEFVQESQVFNFFGVVVPAFWTKVAAGFINPTSKIKLIATVGFPFGVITPEAKYDEADYALDNGADEIDMVLNLGAFKSKEYSLVEKEIKTIKGMIPEQGKLKVIIETGLLLDEEKKKAAKLVVYCGADFVKTCTGVYPGSASIEDIKLIREVIGKNKGIKASGGIRDKQTALALIQAGADRIGTSAGIALVVDEF
jgi:deoxyribose-phosphate aldolase